MAETKAEDDDDESFGDYAFASSFPNQTLDSVQINGQNSVTIDSNDDVEWGDFVEYPLQPVLPNGLPHTQSAPIPSEPPKPFSPFGFFSDHSQSVERSVESVPSEVESGKTQWMKPKGALPLSLFGDAEEEEQSAVVEPSIDDNARNGSNVPLGAGINDVIANLFEGSQQIKAESGLMISISNGSTVNLNYANSHPANGSILNLSGLNSNLNNQSQEIKNGNGFISNLNGVNSNSNEPSSSLTGLNLDFNGLVSNSDSVGGNEEFDDDGGWEFKNACSELKVGDGNDKGFSAVTLYSSEFGNGSHGPIDLFAASNGFSTKSLEMDIGFDFKPSTVAQNGFISDSYFPSEWNDNENMLNSQSLGGGGDADERFGEFKDAFSETESKHKEEPKVNKLSHSEVEVLAFDHKNQGDETKTENHKGAMPLSIFGDEELETDGSLAIQDVFMFNSASYSRNVQSQTSTSISDLLSDLYSQAEPIPSVDNRVFNSNLVNGDDDFENGSWEFKDAISPNRADDQTSLSLGDAHQNPSTKTKLNNYMDFYYKLKDELNFLARCHLDTLKKAQSTAALSGENAKVAALDDEIQKAFKELNQENLMSQEAHSEYDPPRDICLKELLEVLHELKFQALESEYHLSRRLSLAEKNLGSAIELIKHATTMLKILTLVSIEEQFNYVSSWSKMISVCTQELKHGAWIWKQSLENNVQSRILSEPRGKRFILALGEIYRVVVVLGASVKLYKPWLLSSPVDSRGICALLEECHALWSSSGLEEALLSVSVPNGSEYNITVNALLESIKHTHDLDVLALAKLVFAQQESLCQLSVLTPGVVPDMKMVVWKGEHYFLTLANLWANLISCDSPKLPHLHVG